MGRKLLMLLLFVSFILSACKKTEEDPFLSGELIINDTNNIFRIVAEEAHTLSPASNIPLSLAEAISIVYEPLFDFDEAQNPIGVLAEDCIRVSNTQYRVNLKKNVLWHDGDEFNASDVVYTIKALKNSKSVFSADVKRILKAEADGNYKLILTLDRPCVNFVGCLGFPIIKNDSNNEENQGAYPIGTGPYKYMEKRANTYYFEKNDEWHNGVASDKTIAIMLMKDKNSAVYAFEANEADIISSELMDLSHHTPKGQALICNYLSNNLTFLGMNNSEGILSKADIRRAISYLIDKDKIIKENMYGRGVRAEIPLYPKAWFYDKESDAIEVMADSKYLEGLLAQDGWYMKNGFYTKDFGAYEAELTLAILVNRDNPEKMSIARNLKENFEKNGIMINLKTLPYEQYIDKIRNMDFSMFVGEIALDKNMDPSKLVSSGENYFAYESEKMDEVLSSLNNSTEENMREEFSAFAEVFLQDMPFVPLFFREKAIITNPDLSGYAAPNYYRTYPNAENWYFTRRIEKKEE